MSLFVSRMALGAAKGATTAGGLVLGSGVAMNAAKRLGMGAFGQTVSSMGGELVGLLGTSAVLEQQVPKASDWTNAALMIVTLRAGGFAGRKALGLGKQAFSHLEYQRLVPKLRDVYTKTGKTPQDVLNAIKKDPAIIDDLLSKKPLPDAFAEEARTRMLSGEILSMEELKAYFPRNWAKAEFLDRQGPASIKSKIIKLANDTLIHFKGGRLHWGIMHKSEAAKLRAATGQQIPDGMVHTIDSMEIRHAFKNHGNKNSEAKKGQIALEAKDYALIPEVVRNYDSVTVSATGQNLLGFKFSKKIGNTIVVVQEVRLKRNEFTFKTMWKISDNKK